MQRGAVTEAEGQTGQAAFAGVPPLNALLPRLADAQESASKKPPRLPAHRSWEFKADFCHSLKGLR